MRTSPRTHPVRRRAAAIALTVLVGGSAAGCTGEDADDTAVTPAEGMVLPTDPGDAPRLGTLVAPDVRPDGVLLAALLLAAGGDVEAAVADALVTPGEVDAAAAALADGTLAAWVAEAGGSAG